MGTKTEYSSDDVIANLLDNNQPFNPQFLHFFSDISFDNLKSIKTVWPNVDKTRKFNLLKDLELLMEADTLVSCDDFGLFAIEDDDPLIKSQAIHLFWESCDPKLISPFMEFLKNDSHEEVNQAAASALGRFVLLGELGEIPENLAKRVQDFLIDEYMTATNVLTQQRILESLGYSSREKVYQFIKLALEKIEKEWQLSALLAISRSADGKWGKVVMEKLKDIDPDIQTEAVKAAGELEIASAKDTIIELLSRSELYEEVHLQAIWALSKIGGSDVIELLEKMIEESEDEEEIEVIELALENLDLTNGMPSFDIFDQPE
jgi:HEAT repeat protein